MSRRMLGQRQRAAMLLLLEDMHRCLLPSRWQHAQNFTALCPFLPSALLLISNLCQTARHPKNVCWLLCRVCAALRTVRGMSRRMLGQRLCAVLSGERAAMLLLLEDMHRCHDGLPALPASQPLATHKNVYCPLADPPSALNYSNAPKHDDSKREKACARLLPEADWTRKGVSGSAAMQIPLKRLQRCRSLHRRASEACSCKTHELPPRLLDVTLLRIRSASATSSFRGLNTLSQKPEDVSLEWSGQSQGTLQHCVTRKLELPMRSRSAPGRTRQLDALGSGLDAGGSKHCIGQAPSNGENSSCEVLQSRQKTAAADVEHKRATGSAAAGSASAGKAHRRCSAKTRAQKEASLGPPDVQAIHQWLASMGFEVRVCPFFKYFHFIFHIHFHFGNEHFHIILLTC